MKSAWNIMSHFSSYNEWVLWLKIVPKARVGPCFLASCPANYLESWRRWCLMVRSSSGSPWGPWNQLINKKPSKTLPVVFSKTQGGIDWVEGVRGVSKLSRIFLQKICLWQNKIDLKYIFLQKIYLLNPRKYLVQHQGLNALKRRQKRFGAPGQESRRYQGGVGVDSLWTKN